MDGWYGQKRHILHGPFLYGAWGITSVAIQQASPVQWDDQCARRHGNREADETALPFWKKILDFAVNLLIYAYK
jgi:hypothetical protein